MFPAGTFRTWASVRVPYATPRPIGPNRLTMRTRTGRPARRSPAATAAPEKPAPTTRIVGRFEASVTPAFSFKRQRAAVTCHPSPGFSYPHRDAFGRRLARAHPDDLPHRRAEGSLRPLRLRVAQRPHSPDGGSRRRARAGVESLQEIRPHDERRPLRPRDTARPHTARPLRGGAPVPSLRPTGAAVLLLAQDDARRRAQDDAVGLLFRQRLALHRSRDPRASARHGAR